MVRNNCCMDAVSSAQLINNPSHMLSAGFMRDAQGLADLLVGCSAGHQSEDVKLPGGSDL